MIYLLTSLDYETLGALKSFCCIKKYLQISFDEFDWKLKFFEDLTNLKDEINKFSMIEKHLIT